MSKNKTKTEKEEGKQDKKSDLDDTYIGPTDPVHDDGPRQRGHKGSGSAKSRQ